MKSRALTRLVVLLCALFATTTATVTDAGPLSGLGKKAKKAQRAVAKEAHRIFDKKGQSASPPPTTQPAPAGSPDSSAAETPTPSWMPTPEERVRSGKNHPMQGAIQSPLASVGIPPAAVPAVATVLSVGAMAIWPTLLKSIATLLKGLIAGRLKARAKRDKKIDPNQRRFVVMGFVLRPVELGSLLVASCIYGLALCYALKGWALDPVLVLQQTLIVIGIYFLRSFLRFLYERRFGLVTVFRFWPAGCVICLCSALLGGTLATSGYELESAQDPEAAERLIRLKAGLLIITFGMAMVFFLANLFFPQKFFQMGRLLTSGIALAEVFPLTPMPGLRIYQWRRPVWAILFAVIVPAFFVINFVL